MIFKSFPESLVKSSDSMINAHKSIELHGIPLFTWVDLNTPTDEVLPIPSQACFTYFVRGDNQSLSKEENIAANPEHVVVSLCGMTLGKMITEQEAGHINSVIVHFHPEILKAIYKDSKPPHWQEIEAPVTQYVVQMAANNLIKHYINGVMQLFDNKDALTDDILILKLKEIILLLMQTDSSPQLLQIIRSLFSQRTFSFKEIIESYLFMPVSVEDLAGLTNTSLSTFKREFKKIYHTTPASYIMDRRIEKVADYLKVSDDAISTIGYDCGFSTPAHLTRVFKAKYGKTPSEYRSDFTG